MTNTTTLLLYSSPTLLSMLSFLFFTLLYFTLLYFTYFLMYLLINHLNKFIIYKLMMN